MDSEERIYSENVKHLELIQNTITRVANNSFLIKGWTLTISAALTGLAVNTVSGRLSAVASIAIVAFWMLDTVYLRQERLYRLLFENVRENPLTSNRFDMNVEKYKNSSTFMRAALSRTIVVFYSSLLTVSVIVTIIAPHLPKTRS
jgi:hypothetical protein